MMMIVKILMTWMVIQFITLVVGTPFGDSLPDWVKGCWVGSLLLFSAGLSDTFVVNIILKN